MADAVPDRSGAARRRHRAQTAWLAARARPARRPLLLAVIAGLTGALALIAQAWLLAALIGDAVAGTGSPLDRPAALAGLVLIFLLRAATTVAMQWAGFEASGRIRAELRRAVAEKIACLGPSWMKQRQSGAAATLLLERIEALDGYFALYLPQRYLAMLVPAVIILAVLPLDWIVALILAVTGPLIPLFMGLAGLGAAAAAERQMLALERMGGHFLDRLQGLETLNLFGQARRELRLAATVADGFRRRTMAVLRLAFLSSAVLEFFSALAIAMVAVYVGLGLLGLIGFGPVRSLDLADGLLLLLLAPDFFLPLRQLAARYHDRMAAIAAAEALASLLDTPEPAARATLAAVVRDRPVAVALEAVRLRHDGGARVALRGVSLAVAAGERVALVGPSGAGKSSILDVLMGFEIPDAGRLRLDGAVADGAAIGRQAAWIGQRTRLFHGTLRDNIALGCPDAEPARIRAAAAAARVTEFADALPQGLDSMVGEGGYGLSVGEAQRVALARALAAARPLLLMDEPTAGLDAENEARILEAVAALRGCTLIVATHSPAVIAGCDRVIRLSRGRIVGSNGGGGG